MATTTWGLPYPVGTDKVVDGDNAIKALAEAVEVRYNHGIIQCAQAIVTTNVYGQAYIFPPNPITGNFPVVMAQNMGGGTDPWYLVAVQSMDAGGTSFNFFARKMDALGSWAANITMRITWIAIGGF